MRYGQDRANKVLRYIAQKQVDNPSAERRQLDILPVPASHRAAGPRPQAAPG